LCDIDYFKRYNDNYGHIAGDTCLQAVATAIASVFKRAGDLVARYGGEEFAVILPVTDAGSAESVAERMRQAVLDLAIPHSTSRVADHVTLSVGVATLPAGERITPQRFAALADEALYTAKANGRNRVERQLEPFAAGLAKEMP
jgi:diguanylate cyclase (GGDEF)-like protein